jgi:hypothetical protein
LSEINVISSKITSLIELEQVNMESERKWTEAVSGGRKSPYINSSKLYQTSVISNRYDLLSDKLGNNEDTLDCKNHNCITKISIPKLGNLRRIMVC